jgi:SAM-dependent methyltransferase
LYFDMLGVADRSKPILDFGCATGNASSPFIGHDYTGIDIDADLINFARLKFRRHPEMRFVAADIFDFAPAKLFQYILLAGVAHHLDDHDLPRILERLHSLLNRQGHIYFIDPVITGRERPLLRLLMSLDQGKYHRGSDAYARLFERLGYSVFDYQLLTPSGAIFPVPQVAFFKIR